MSTDQARLGDEPQLDPSHLEGRHRSRVFIGGSYQQDNISCLDYLVNAVRSVEFVPVIANRYWLEYPDDIHSVTMALLHSCRLAVFEMSVPSGALMEIERLPDYGIRALVLYADPDNKGWVVSRMLSTFLHEHDAYLTLKSYVREETAAQHVVDWLDTMKGKGFG